MPEHGAGMGGVLASFQIRSSMMISLERRSIPSYSHSTTAGAVPGKQEGRSVNYYGGISIVEAAV